MSYSMFLAGKLELPVAKMKSYLAAPVEPERRRDGIGMLDLLRRGVVEPRSKPGESVELTLKQLPKRVITRSGSWLEITLASKSGQLSIQGVLVEDDFVDHGATLAELWRIASDFEGQGELYLLEEQVAFNPQEPELCYAVRVAPRSSRVEHIEESQQAELIEGELFAEVLARIQREAAQAPNPFNVTIKKSLAKKRPQK